LHYIFILILTPFLLKRASIDIVLLKQNEIPFPSLECSKLGGGKSKDGGKGETLERENDSRAWYVIYCQQMKLSDKQLHF
jgi:hypothetical protein